MWKRYNLLQGQSMHAASALPSIPAASDVRLLLPAAALARRLSLVYPRLSLPTCVSAGKQSCILQSNLCRPTNGDNCASIATPHLVRLTMTIAAYIYLHTSLGTS